MMQVFSSFIGKVVNRKKLTLILIAIHVCGSERILAQCIGEQWMDSTIRLGSISFQGENFGIVGGEQVQGGDRSGVVLVTTDGGHLWGIPIIPDSSQAEAYISVKRFDSLRMVIVSEYGQIMNSYDGGNTWHRKGRIPVSQFSVSFADMKHGLASTHFGEIYGTTDSGSTWDIRTYTYEMKPSDVVYIDSLHAVVVCGTEVLRTTDGGRNSWLRWLLPMGDQLAHVSAMDLGFIMIVGGYFSGVNSGIAWSVDSGAHWRQTSLSHPNSVSRAHFMNRSNAFVTGARTILSTRDGGWNWVEQMLPESIGSVRDAAFLPSGRIILVSTDTVPSPISRITELSSENCSAMARVIYPVDRAPGVPMNQNYFLPRSIDLKWSYEGSPIATHSRLQLSRDSLFRAVIVDSLIPHDVSIDTIECRIPLFDLRRSYFWRLALRFIDGKQSAWSRPFKFTTAGTIIRGSVFNDLNRDSTWTSNEPPLQGWPISLSGTSHYAVSTNSNGLFSFIGIDSGAYVLADDGGLPWLRTLQSSGAYSIVVGNSDTLTDLDFGRYYPWCSVSGKVFHDLNENGEADSLESGLTNWVVRLYPTNQWTRTDSLGYYSFDEVLPGTYMVYVDKSPGWELVRNKVEHQMTFQNLDEHITNRNFAAQPIPPRVKLQIWVTDAYTGFGSLTFGVRAGASYGIWGVGSGTTNQDFSEGEYELPQKVLGAFDARFEDPHGVPEFFGHGGSTDMRPFTSPAQADTYKISFQPAYWIGGDYPMKLEWYPESISQSYLGSVKIMTDVSFQVDMKLVESFSISDRTDTSVLIIAEQPVLRTNAIEVQNPSLPFSTALFQNYPNPFNPRTKLRFWLATASHVRLDVYDVLGERVANIVDEKLPPGIHEKMWDGRSVPSGVYFYRLISGDYVSVKKMLLLR